MKTAPSKLGYRANFLWPHKDGSLEQVGYEFANAQTEGYREMVWKELLKRAKAKYKSNE